MRITRSPKRHAKELLDGLLSAGADQRSVVDLLIAKANENKEEYANIRPNPKVIDIVRVNETPLLQRVSGDDIDISTMTRNALKNEEEIRMSDQKKYNQELQQRVERFLVDKDVSQAKAAPMMGVSQTALSQWRRSMYDKGNVEEFENKIGEFFRAQDAKEQAAEKRLPTG